MKTPRYFLATLLVVFGSLFAHPNVAQADADSATKQVARFRDFIPLDDGRKIWVEADIVDPKAPTKFNLNGLTNSAAGSFKLLTDAYLKKGENVIRFDFPGQATTLLANPSLDQDFGYRAQARVVVELLPKILTKVGLQGKVDALGQSYGGGILIALATFEQPFVNRYFRSLTAFAPYTEPLRSQDESIKREIKWWRKWYPNLNDYSDQELYDMIFYRTVMSSYWWYEPEIIGRTPDETRLYLEGVHALAKGIRSFNAGDYISLLGDTRLNIVMASDDQYIPSDVIPKFWSALPAKNRGYFVTLYRSEHKMLQVMATLSSDIEELTANPVKEIPLGSEIEAYWPTSRIHYGSQRYELGKLIGHHALP
jgi:hypothetical protein